MIKLFGAWLLVFTVSQAPAQPSDSERIQVQQTITNLTQGRPPASPADIILEQDRALNSLRNFESLLNLSSNFSKKCERFRALSSRLSSDLRSGVEKLPVLIQEPPSDEEFELSNRIQIEIAIFQMIDYMIRNDVEGGFGVLDVKEKHSCPFANRAELKISAQETLKALTFYFRARFGSPGLATMEATQQRLLFLALQDEASENRKFWIYTGALTAASIVLWETAPVAVAFGARSLWGFTPRLLYSPRVIFGIQVSALTVEGFAFAYAEALAADHPEAPKVFLGSWEEYMESISTVVESPIHAPQLQMVLLSRVQNMIFGEALPWLKAVSQQKNSDSILRLEMMQTLNGANPDAQVHRLAKWIEQTFHFRVRCSSKFFGSTSSLQCLYGMRSIAIAMIQRMIPRPQEPVIIEIGDRWEQMNMRKSTAEIKIPYLAAQKDIASFVKWQISQPSYAGRVRLLTEIEELRQRVEKKSGKDVQIDPRLDNPTAATGLVLLDMYLADKKIVGPVEVIEVSDSFRLPFEENMKLVESINASASLAQLDRYLNDRDRFGSGQQDAWPNSFFRQRVAWEKATEEFSRKHAIDEIACSPSPGMSYFVCRRGLERLSQFLSSPSVKLPHIDRLGITSSEDMPMTADYSRDLKENKSILIIRHDFGSAPLMHHFRDLGWEVDLHNGGTR